MTLHNPIDHHYLPVFYLNSWRRPDGRVVRYYRPYNEVVASPIAPSNTGYEPRLYSLEGYPPEIQQALERNFMAPGVDEPASRAIDVLIARDREKMTPAMRQAWTRFLMSMQLRDPHTLAEIQRVAAEVVRANLSRDDAEYLAARRADDPATIYEWAVRNVPHQIENLNKSFLPGLIDHEKIGTHIMNMHWSTFDLSGSKFTLLTGDRPFIRSHGLGDKKCILTFPLTPTLLFVATNDKQMVRNVLDQNTVSDLVRKTNQAIVYRAAKHVFGNTGRHLSFVEKRLLCMGAVPLPGVLAQH